MKTSVAVLLVCMFLTAPVAHAQSRKTDAAKPQGASAPPPPAWDHKGHIRLCADPGDKRCTILTIPSGITDILGVVSTKVVPDVQHSFVILSRKNSYLCASGIRGIVELRCQRLPKDPAGGAQSPELAAAQLQNTITSLLATRIARPQEASFGGGCGFGGDSDMEGFCEDTGGLDVPGGFEIPGSGGGGGWDGGAGAGGYTDIGAADVQATYQALADKFVTEDFNRGLAGFWGVWAANSAQMPMKCETVISQCRDTCGNLQGLETAGCAALAGGATLISGPIGFGVGFYCVGKVTIVAEECKAGCNTPQIICTQ
jgi:hypothetical protein